MDDLRDGDEGDWVNRDSYDDLRISDMDMRPPDRRMRPPRWRIPRSWSIMIWAVTALALLVLILSALPGGGPASALARFARPTATPHSSSNISMSSSNFGSFTPMPTSDLSAQPSMALASAPASCGGTAIQLEEGGPPSYTLAIGKSPVWLSGFTRPGATARIGPRAMANSWGGWTMPYTQYGWPAPMVLDLKAGFTAPITLYGYNLQTNQSVSFGLIEAGPWGPPQAVMSAYPFDPEASPIPAGGSDSTGTFWYGYMFFPQAGCYQINAAWPGGSWSEVVSAGR